jgi:hypothetical protein
MVAANKSMAATNERMARVSETMAASDEKAENTKNLLGEKETVGYAAIRPRQDGLPPDVEDRRVVLDAIMQACVFEHSARARALLYKVLQENLAAYRHEIEEALHAIEHTFSSMERCDFTKEPLDLERGQRRLEMVRKVVEAS